MDLLSTPFIAKVGAGLLLLVVIRCLGEFFRLAHLRGEALTIADIRPFVIGALVAALALAAALICILAGTPQLAIAIAGITIAGLFVWKVFVVG